MLLGFCEKVCRLVNVRSNYLQFFVDFAHMNLNLVVLCAVHHVYSG